MIFLPIDMLGSALSSAVGIPVDQGKVLVWLLIHIGCGYGYRKIKGGMNRNLYGMILGILFCLSMFGSQTLILIAYLIPLYYATMFYPKKAAINIYIGGFVCLSLYHIKRMVDNYGGYDMDLTLMLMQQLIRVTYFGWAIYDKHTPLEKLPEFARERILPNDPTLLEFIGYNFNFLGILCPTPDFYDYIEFIHEKGNYASITPKKADHLIVARNSVIALVVYVLASTFLYNPSDTTKDFVMNKNILAKLVIFNIAGIVFRCKYYVLWLITQLGMDLSGVTWNQKTGNYDKYESSRPIDVEWTFWDAKRRTLVWNMGTQRWLRLTFYDRFVDKIGKSKGSLFTFTLSAFWHGFYLCYYLAFFYFHMCLEIQTIIYKNQELFLGPAGTQKRKYLEWAIDFVYMTWTNIAAVTFGAGLTFSDIWKIQKATWFSALHPVIIYFALVQYLKANKPKKVQHK